MNPFICRLLNELYKFKFEVSYYFFGTHSQYQEYSALLNKMKSNKKLNHSIHEQTNKSIE